MTNFKLQTSNFKIISKFLPVRQAGQIPIWKLMVGIYFVVWILLFGFNPQSQAQQFVKIYSVYGAVQDAPDVSASGHEAILYRNQAELDAGIYVKSKISKSLYLFIPTFNPLLAFNAGETFKVAVVQDKSGYGAGPVDIKISGAGYDEAPLMTMAIGAGVSGELPPQLVPGASGKPPLIEWLKFGDRIYQKTLVEKGEKFIVSATPKISAKVSSTLAIKTDKLVLKINESGGPTPSYSLQIKESNITNKEFSAKGAKEVTALAFTYDVPPENKLGEGVNTITLVAEGVAGVTSEVAYVSVVAGQVQVVGNVLTYPSPYSPQKHSEVIIQYTLSTNGNMDVFIFSPVGEIIKKFVNSSGQNGGAAGVNKITWNGRLPSGMVVGNGVYSGAVVERDTGKILAKFKLTVAE